MILKLFSDDRKKIEASGKSSASLLIIHHYLQKHPITDAKKLTQECKISLPTINKSLRDLSKLNIVKEITGKEDINNTNVLNNFLVNGRFSLELHYLFNEKFSMLIRPQFRVNLTSVLKNNYAVEQYYYSTGMNVGITYRFK